MSRVSMLLVYRHISFEQRTQRARAAAEYPSAEFHQEQLSLLYPKYRPKPSQQSPII
jgi:hypothetical protein